MEIGFANAYCPVGVVYDDDLFMPRCKVEMAKMSRIGPRHLFGGATLHSLSLSSQVAWASNVPLRADLSTALINEMDRFRDRDESFVVRPRWLLHFPSICMKDG